MPFVADRLMNFVRETRPDIFDTILLKIRPHSLEAVLKIFECHLRRVPDLNVFNQNIDAVPQFVWAFVKFLKLPCPGDAIGIQMTCRVTKSATQGTLDSKHLQTLAECEQFEFNVEKDLLNELAIFSTQVQVFEFANRHKYATAFVSLSVDEVRQNVPRVGFLERGYPMNKGKNLQGEYEYLSTFQFVVVEDRGSVKVLYKSLRDLHLLQRCVPLKKLTAYSDVRVVHQKAGIISHFFNMNQLADLQLFDGEDTPYRKDVRFFIKFQCRNGNRMPMTRDGLAKNPFRTPIEATCFEAFRKNASRIVTRNPSWYGVESSTDKIFFGQQFNEGTGYEFALLGKGS